MLEIKFAKAPFSKRLFYVSLLLLTYLYPGHYSWQTVVLKPGEVLSYTSPLIELAPYPQSAGIPATAYSAAAIVVQDVDSRRILFEQNPRTTLFPASTTKIMTALVALDFYSPEQIIVVNQDDLADGQRMGLVVGEAITFQSLLYGLLIQSGNDAAMTLANHYEGGYHAFITAMNNKAAALHLDDTYYLNPIGFDAEGHTTTARDLAILASIAMENTTISQIVVLPQVTVTDVTGTTLHPLQTTNELIGELDGIKGLKTGWTENAGECLVTFIERDGHPVIIVVLNSADRFGDTRSLIDWVYSHHTWIRPI